VKIPSTQFALLLLLCLLPLTGRAETIILAADEWAPFNIQPNKQPEGYMVTIAREVFNRHNIDIVYKVVPWNRALEGAKKGEYTGAIGPSKTEAPYLVFPDEELARNHMSYWVKKGNPWRFTDHNSVSGITLGIIEGYNYQEWLNTYIQTYRNDKSKIQIVFGEAPAEMNLRKLIIGRVGAIVDSEATIRYTAKQLNLLDDIEIAGRDNETCYGYIAFTPTNPRATEFARMLSEGIVLLRASGRLQEILSVYGLKDWKE
jgi:polar amino acid transport system substrate-binding protein